MQHDGDDVNEGRETACVRVVASAVGTIVSVCECVCVLWPHVSPSLFSLLLFGEWKEKGQEGSGSLPPFGQTHDKGISLLPLLCVVSVC